VLLPSRLVGRKLRHASAAPASPVKRSA
jgi:hypothetical protein